MSALSETNIAKRLQLLWKGTLFISITCIYVLIVGHVLIYKGWLQALLAFFLIGLGQFFRYIFNDVDRMGWSIYALEKDKVNPRTKKYQKRMFYFLISLVQLTNISLLIQGYILYGIFVCALFFAGLFIVELLYYRIRGTNKKVGYEKACYGIKDKGVISGGPEEMRPEKRKRRISLEEKLEKLRKMAEEGKISMKAYEKN